MVSLPSAAPFIATGIRLASSVAIILDIAHRLHHRPRSTARASARSSRDASTGAGNLTVILAATVWAGILGLVLDLLLTVGQRRLLPGTTLRLGETGPT